MYQRVKHLPALHSASMMTKNLQVVSFDSAWNEIYVGSVHGDTFSAACPNKTSSEMQVHYRHGESGQNVTITSAKWCPLDHCTILVIGKHYH